MKKMINANNLQFLIAFQLLVILLPAFSDVFAQDFVHQENYCEQAAALNQEAFDKFYTDRRLALSKAELALALAEKHGCASMEALAHRYIGIVHYFIGDYVTAEPHFNKSMQIYRATNDSTGISSIYNNRALLFVRTGAYDSATENFEKSKIISEKINDIKGIEKTLLNISLVYFYQGRFTEALANTKQAYEIAEMTEDIHGMMLANNSIAAIFETQGLYEEALETYTDALKQAQKLENNDMVSRIMHNMGTVYYELGDYETALRFYTNSLLLKVNLDDRAGISLCLSNMGSVYRAINQIDKSNSYFHQALKIDQELGNQRGIAIQLAQIAGNLLKKNEPLSAIDYYNQSNSIAYELNARYLLKENYKYLVTAYLSVQNYDAAYTYLQNYVSFRDDMVIPPEYLMDQHRMTRYDDSHFWTLNRMKEIGLLRILLFASLITNFILLILLIKRIRQK